MLGAAVASGVLVGALAVGDSVRFTLGQRAAARVGAVDAAIAGGDRFFRSALADELAGGEAVRAAGALPFVVGSLVYMTTPAYIMQLFTTDTGHLFLTIGVVMMSMGILVMRKMINFDL